MSTEKRETSLLEIMDKESNEYHWDFKLPPKSRIKQNMMELSGGGGFVFNELTFKTGILAEVEHEFMFAVYSNQVNVYLTLPCKSNSRKYQIKNPCKLELFSHDRLMATKELKFTFDDMSTSIRPHSLYASAWINNDESWDDSIDLMRVTLIVECETVGQVVKYAFSDLKKKFRTHPPPLELNASDLFLSNELSDAVFICDDKEYPAHRFLLSCKSPVFKQMFQHNMKEATEGRIVIEDVEPKVLKEMLRYLYCGIVKNIKEVSFDLFIAAEKYQIEGLRDKCELELYENITPENALDMYILADTHNGAVLKEKAISVLKKLKTEVIPDSEIFQEFTRQYPELMFELYKL